MKSAASSLLRIAASSRAATLRRSSAASSCSPVVSFCCLSTIPTNHPTSRITQPLNNNNNNNRNPLAAVAVSPPPLAGKTTSTRSFASDAGSHSDFAPQKKVAPPDDAAAALQLIEQHVKANPVMLYMKGTPSMPMCGFSAKVVTILAEQAVDYGSVNVLDYPTVREGVKQYSQWPTIPQLYVQGEFIGGCDILTDMHASGELEEVLKPVKEGQAEKKE